MEKACENRGVSMGKHKDCCCRNVNASCIMFFTGFSSVYGEKSVRYQMETGGGSASKFWLLAQEKMHSKSPTVRACHPYREEVDVGRNPNVPQKFADRMRAPC